LLYVFPDKITGNILLVLSSHLLIKINYLPKCEIGKSEFFYKFPINSKEFTFHIKILQLFGQRKKRLIQNNLSGHIYCPFKCEDDKSDASGCFVKKQLPNCEDPLFALYYNFK